MATAECHFILQITGLYVTVDSVAQLLEIVEVLQVDAVGDASPRDVVEVAQAHVHAVDAAEGEAVAVGRQSADEGDAQLVEVALGQIVVVVAHGDERAVGRAVVRLPVLGDGGQQSGRVAVVVPSPVASLWAPDGDIGMVGQALSPEGVVGLYAEEREVVVVGAEALAEGDDVGRVVVVAAGRCGSAEHGVDGREGDDEHQPCPTPLHPVVGLTFWWSRAKMSSDSRSKSFGVRGL